MDELEELVKRRSAHERLMRLKGFNRNRLWLIDLNPRSKKPFIELRARVEFPTFLEWLLALAIAAVIVGAYFWRTELQRLWPLSTGVE
jgi:hypothetical protein